MTGGIAEEEAVMGFKKVIMTAVGTAGDVYPAIGVGAALHARGHEVHVLANPFFEESVRGMSLGFLPLGRVEDYHRGLADPDLWHPRRGLRAVMRSLMPDALETYEVLMEEMEPERTVVVAHPFDFASRMAQEKHGISCLTMVLSPCLFRSRHRIPVMRGARDLSSMAPLLKSMMWKLADSLLIDPAVLPGLNETRRTLGLKPVRRPFDGWIFSPKLTIGLFPNWFGEPQPDWPSQVQLTGFPLFQSARPVPAEAETFLDAGSAPIVFIVGSGVANTQAFFEVAVEACQSLRRRGLLLAMLGKEPAWLRVHRDDFLYLPFAPLEGVLSRCAAVVHHGGIGTTGAALAAGVPQIVRPVAHDQPDHAARVVRLGVGERLLPEHFTSEALSTMLAGVLDDAEMNERCAEFAERIRCSDVLGATCDLIEERF